MDDKRQQRVAIIGSGLAGLTAAHILKSASLPVTIFDQSSELSFDSASVSIEATTSSSLGHEKPKEERVDMPMRAVLGGYYENVMRMYAHLGIVLHPVRFLFVFAKVPKVTAARDHESKGGKAAGDKAYFVHSSNLHQIPPPRPDNRNFVLYVIEVVFLLICHAWFTAACSFVRPLARPIAAQPGCNSKLGAEREEVLEESLREYLHRIWLPRRYASHYLLPLMSSVSTCSHSEMLDFPARDVVNYSRSTGHQHYVVCGGVRRVQEHLVSGISDIRLGACVVGVQPVQGGVSVSWRSSGPNAAGGSAGKRADSEEKQEVFDQVILAVSPDVAGKIFSPARPLVGCIPTRKVESSVLAPGGQITHRAVVDLKPLPSSTGCAHPTAPGKAQVITFRTRFSGSQSTTEALHETPSGVLVQSCPLEETKDALTTALFTRTLRTVESQRAVRRVFAPRNTGSASGRQEEQASGSSEWINGQDGVWLVGAWCWDGMVLLEGCVVSATRVARGLGVKVPWER